MILDCYSDPLGWKDQLMMSGNFTDVSYEASLSLSCVCRNVKDLDKLYSLILELGKGLFGQGKDCFSVAIDSDGSKDMDMMLAILLEWHQEQISSIFWLLHSDLHEVKVTSVLEYLSYVSEGFHIDQSDINFTSVSSEDELFNQINQGLLPKVQFNLDLSEKECIGRARVVLSFDLQGNGKPIQIHDSGRSLAEGKTEVTLGSSWTSQKAEDYGEGDIIYFLDSDDEMPDSDEDSDDDLDV
ncbi:hypothetical protein NC653_038481 [Populus alba x Populus x berolinensis]|uniref:Elongator complex protein 5 n=1 Tax=Populus alba x Populus x berolinensis TaxID=444605 RepID=A0AAD6PU94_9ROSI|nr:hypothetical protein NC653_038481 [Populus alba x Populus x berolinensis]